MKPSKYFKLFFNYFLHHKYYRKTKKVLRNNSLATQEDIRRFQYEKIKEIIEYVYKNVPYYRELFSKINFHPDDFKSIEDIKKIPFLTKNIVRENQDRLLSKMFDKKNIKIAETGGTTGLPMTFYLDKRTSSLLEMAYLEDMWKIVNYSRYDRCVILRGDVVKGIVPDKKYWSMNYITNWLTLSSLHLNADTFPLYYKKISSFKPKFIIAYPSNAYLVAKFIKENNIQNFSSLKAIICSSENMYDWQREFMEDVFGVRVYSYYGHSEKCVIAGECSNSKLYEFYPQYGFVELINENNQWCEKEGELGEIIATGFNNMAAPFLRYRTGDMGVYTKKRGGDHPNWFTIAKIEGRKQDFIVDSNGTHKPAIHLDRPFWKIRNEIYSYQYIQDFPGKIKVFVHSKRNLTKDQIEEIKKIFLDTYFKIEIEVYLTDNISRTKSGKFRYLVQNIKDT